MCPFHTRIGKIYLNIIWSVKIQMKKNEGGKGYFRDS